MEFTEIKIFHFNDIHSRFEELAKIASYIQQHKTQSTIIFDTGDNADFMRMEVEGTQGKISTDILNYIGITAQVWGNNEGFAGKIIGKMLATSSNFPILVANLYDSAGLRLEYLTDFQIIGVHGIKILLVGVTAPYEDFYSLFDIKVSNPIQEIKNILLQIPKEQYDLLIVLSHLGDVEDRKLAKEIPNIDVIIGGHFHKVLEQPIIEQNTIICQAGSYGNYVGELTLNIDKNVHKISSYTFKLVSTQEIPQDIEIIKIITKNRQISEEYLSKPLYNLNCSLTHSFSDENELGNLLADALVHITQAEIGITNSGVLNHGIEKGMITKKMLHEISPSPLNPTYIEIQGKNILETLEKSLSPKYHFMNGKGSGFRGKWVGNIQVSKNVLIYYDSASLKIRKFYIDGKDLELERWYKVGTSDYLQRGTGYEEMGYCRNVKYYKEYIRDVLETYLNKSDFVISAKKTRLIKN